MMGVPILLGPLERANLNHPVIDVSSNRPNRVGAPNILHDDGNR
jgi:hypothetical protein